MNARLIAIIGAAILIVGHFLPVLNSVDPTTGGPISVNFIFNDGKVADGVVTAGLAIVALILALLNMTKHVVWPALLGLGWLAWRFFDLKGQVDTQVSALAAIVPPEVLQTLNVGMNYLGWGVLFLGSIIMLAGGVMGWKGQAAAPPPPAV